MMDTRLKHLSPVQLREMMKKSEEKIAVEKENINAINVFPIPDGDTGSNMFYTIKAIVEEVNNASDSDYNSILQAISKGAFVGAKGNSGVIYSQFLIGIVEYLEDKEVITPVEFSEALREGTEFAYDAVLNPTEGTILTVMQRVAEKAKELTSENPNINWLDYMEELVKAGKEALEETKELLDVLKAAGVVDAGAKGFVHILESWRDVIAGVRK